jgi:hypothetical protein
MIRIAGAVEGREGGRRRAARIIKVFLTSGAYNGLELAGRAGTGSPLFYVRANLSFYVFIVAGAHIDR